MFAERAKTATRDLLLSVTVSFISLITFSTGSFKSALEGWMVGDFQVQTLTA